MFALPVCVDLRVYDGAEDSYNKALLVLLLLMKDLHQ